MDENSNEINNTQNHTSVNEYHFKHYWKESVGMLLASFLGGFLAIYFVADQVFDNHHQDRFFMPSKQERQMMKDFNKMYERERKNFERDFYNFDKSFAPHKHKNEFNFNDKWFNTDKKENKKDELLLNPFIVDTMADSVKIKTKIDDDKYKVIVGLNEFQGDENKINYNVSGRKLTVFGVSKVKEKDFEQNISFSHDFILPYNADISKITKKKDDNKLVIEIPLKM